jgi:neutral ceramidase
MGRGLSAAALLAAAALCVSAGAAFAALPPPVLRAGAAQADITPPIGTPMFAYTARSYVFSPDPAAIQEHAMQVIADPDTGLYAKSFEPSNGIHTRVRARALVLKNGTGPKFALVQADLGGLPYALVQEVLKRIKATGIDGNHLLLSATHTHSSLGDIWPVDNSGYAFVGGDAFDPRIFQQTAQAIADAIIAANARLAPARLGVGTGQLTGASRNREFESFQRNPDIPPASDPAGQRAASIDPTMTVVRVDAADGTPMAVWSNFAVHPTSFGDGNLLFSGDNAGVAERLTEQAIVENAQKNGHGTPAVVNVWTNDAEGDTSPDGDDHSIGGQSTNYVPTDAAKAHLAGSRVAAGIVAAWHDAGQHMTGDADLNARRSFLLFDGTSYGASSSASEPVGPNPVLGQGGIVMDDGTCAPVDNFAGPGQGEKMPLLGGVGITPSTVPVSFWRIGRLGIAAYPAEITKQMGKRIKTALLGQSAGAFDSVIIAGLTNGYISYTATPQEYGACSYEGSFTLFGRQEGYAWLSTGSVLEAALLSGRAATGALEPPEEAIGTTQSTPPRATANAGTAVAQPVDTLRYGRAMFTWNGGDPQVDAARGRPFVSLQRSDGAGGWSTVATDDTFYDTTQRAAHDVWTETFQFDGCWPTGTYRFHVTGRAVRSLLGAPADYTLDSRSFALGRLTIAPGTPTVSGGVASVRPLYPDPGAGALVSLPRLVMGATVNLTLSDGRVKRAFDADHDGVYTTNVGSASVTRVSVVDDCGNASS